jgi:hypothetical protein
VWSVIAAMREGRWAERAALLDSIADTLERTVLDQAIASWPDDPILLLMRAQQAMAWAWRARGRGGASTVSKEGWLRFEERMAMAERDLLRAMELDPADPTPHGRLVKVASALDQGEATARRHLEAAVVRDAADYSAREAYFTYFCLRRYNGSYEKMHALAEDAARGAPEGDLRHTFLFQTHEEMWSYEHAFGDPRVGDAYAARPDVQAAVAATYARSVGSAHHVRTIASLRPIDRYARWFFAVGDQARCRHAFSLVGEEQWTRSWGMLGPADKQAAIARAWAFGRGPHQILGWDERK